MGSFTMRLTLISFYLPLCSFFIDSLKASFLPSNPDPLTDIACAVVNCGQGTCKASNATLLGFDCECNPGWKKIQIGPLTFPSCLVPNCTLDFGCGSATSPVPAPAPAPALDPLLLPPLNISDPCSLIWCGDGTCVANGTAYICNCNEGSANLLNLTDLACFKDCYFGSDCIALGFGKHVLPPPPPPPPPPSPPLPRPPPPSPTTSGSTRNGSSEVPNCSRSRHGLTILLLGAIFLSWV